LIDFAALYPSPRVVGSIAVWLRGFAGMKRTASIVLAQRVFVDPDKNEPAENLAMAGRRYHANMRIFQIQMMLRGRVLQLGQAINQHVNASGIDHKINRV
jgi:hypothetical protein